MQRAQNIYTANSGHNGGKDKRIKNAKVHHTNDVDHIATASVCSLLFRGILEGTKSMLGG